MRKLLIIAALLMAAQSLVRGQDASPTPSAAPSAAPTPQPVQWTDQDSANLAGSYQVELWIFGAILMLPIVLKVRV